MPTASPFPSQPQPLLKLAQGRQGLVKQKQRQRQLLKECASCKGDSHNLKSGKAVSKVTTLKRPSTRNLITPERYIKDIQTRWQIHQYEIQELLRDLNKGLTFVTPYHDQLVKQVKAWTV